MTILSSRAQGGRCELWYRARGVVVGFKRLEEFSIHITFYGFRHLSVYSHHARSSHFSALSSALPRSRFYMMVWLCILSPPM